MPMKQEGTFARAIANKSAMAETDLDALARMIEYARAEARRHGYQLTSHLLDLAASSLWEESAAHSAPSARQ